MPDQGKRIGRPPKLPPHTTFVLRVPDELYGQLVRKARARRESLNDFILRELGWKWEAPE